MRLRGDRGRGPDAQPSRHRPHDRERMRLRRLRRPRVPAGTSISDHARGELLRETRSSSVPAGAARLGRRRRRALRRRLPLVGSRVGGVARPRRPPAAGRLRAASGVAAAAARLGGTPPARARCGRTREGRSLREGVRVPRCGPPDPAVVPPDGAAAELIRETGAGTVVAPERRRRHPRRRSRALHAPVPRRRPAGASSSRTRVRDRLSRRARVEETAALLREVAP